MKMQNPPHPGQIIKSAYLEELGLSYRDIAELLDVSASTVGRIVTEKSSVTPEMAVRLSKSLGRSPESWLKLQYQHDLWHVQQKDELFENVKQL